MSGTANERRPTRRGGRGGRPSLPTREAHARMVAVVEGGNQVAAQAAGIDHDLVRKVGFRRSHSSTT